MIKICSALDSYNTTKAVIDEFRKRYFSDISEGIDSCANAGLFDCVIDGSEAYRNRLGISDDVIRSLLESLGYTVEVNNMYVHIYWNNPKTCHSKCDGE